MSFISIEHFAEPFRNKIHLVAICIAAALFGILRMQGGGVNLEDAITKQSSLKKRQKLIPQNSRTRGATQTNKKVIYKKKPQRSNSNNSNTRDSGLDEIERTLGLR